VDTDAHTFGGRAERANDVRAWAHSRGARSRQSRAFRRNDRIVRTERADMSASPRTELAPCRIRRFELERHFDLERRFELERHLTSNDSVVNARNAVRG
jgi:hypothetical protein